MATIQINVPDIGDFADVEVIEILVAPGDVVKAEDPLISLESDKATMEVPSPQAGTVKSINVNIGDKISEGSPVVVLETDSAEAASTEAAAPAPEPAAVTAAPAPTEGASVDLEILVPDIGDFAEVEVIEVLVSPGDLVKEEDPLITLESDKASMEVPSSAAGKVKAVKVSIGDKVSEGSLVVILESVAAVASASVSAAPPAQAPAVAAPAAPVSKTPAPAVAASVNEAAFAKVHASPSIRRFARELGADLGKVKGTGRKERILKSDVTAFIKQVMSGASAVPAVSGGSGIPPIPPVDFSKFGETESKPLSRIKKLTGINLSRAWLNLPMVTHHEEADITEMEDFRISLKGEAEKRGVRITGLTFMMKALVGSLKAFPQFNASLSPDGENLIYKKYFNVGIAVDTPNGLVVPVFKDVDQKSIYELSAEMGELSAKARDGKLGPKDMQGACMTISSLGGIGGTAFTPIVNPPEVAILGVTRAQMKPVWNGKEFVPRLMQPLDLTYDHRVIDGADGARFSAHLAQSLSDIRRLLL